MNPIICNTNVVTWVGLDAPVTGVCGYLTAEAPLVSKNFIIQRLIVAGEDVTYHVTGIHNGVGVALFDGDFEGLQIDFTNSLLIGIGMQILPPMSLLII